MNRHRYIHLVWTHFKFIMIELIRMPSYVLPTILFPSAVVIFISLIVDIEENFANFMAASFAAVAVFSVAFFQFGTVIAGERNTTWEVFLRGLPLPVSVRILARIFSAILFSTLSALLVFVTCWLFTPLYIVWMDWLRLMFGVIFGAIPFAFAGLGLAYWLSAKSAVAVGSPVFVFSCIFGGLFAPPDLFPKALDRVSLFFPTRHYGEIAWAAALGEPWQSINWLVLAAYGVLFAVLAVYGFYCDEGRKFR